MSFEEALLRNLPPEHRPDLSMIEAVRSLFKVETYQDGKLVTEDRKIKVWVIPPSEDGWPGCIKIAIDDKLMIFFSHLKDTGEWYCSGWEAGDYSSYQDFRTIVNP